MRGQGGGRRPWMRGTGWGEEAMDKGDRGQKGGEAMGEGDRDGGGHG